MKEYGFDSIVKEYANFPKFLSLPCHMEHGWTKLSDPLPTDLKTKKKLMLVFSRRRADAWKKSSKIHVEIIGAPFIIYRHMYGVKKKLDAKGTIVFPAHSCLNLEAMYDVDKFCDDLMELGSKYQPFTICMHPFDFRSNVKLKYEERGFKVVTAEATETNSFVENFYVLLQQHQFAVSNEIGSAAFYAIEMEIPFFLVGDPPQEVNDGNEPNAPMESNYLDYSEGKVAYKNFCAAEDKVTDMQKQYVISELGYNERIAPNKLLYILIKNYFKFEIWDQLINHLKLLARKILTML